MAALLGLTYAHGGLGGAIVELAAALLIVVIALAAWVGGRRERNKP